MMRNYKIVTVLVKPYELCLKQSSQEGLELGVDVGDEAQLLPHQDLDEYL